MAGLNHDVFHLYNFGGLPIFTWNNPHKNWQKPCITKIHQGNLLPANLEIFRDGFSHGNKVLMVDPNFEWKNKASNTTLSPPKKKN